MEDNINRDNMNSEQLTKEEEERPIWNISILSQRPTVACYYCDTRTIDKIKYYGSEIRYVSEKWLLLTNGQKLILEFIDRSKFEYERGWLLKLGYGVEKHDGTMTVFKKGEDNKIKYNLDPPTYIPEVPDFSIDIHIRELIDGESAFDIFKKYGNDINAVKKAIEIEFHKKILDKKDLKLDSKEGNNGIIRTYTYTSPIEAAIIVDSINIFSMENKG